MSSLLNFNALGFEKTLLAFFVAVTLGAIIGAERQWRQRNAGLRTNALVALGASAFVDLATRLNGNLGGVQVLAYIASGVGFLGAGVILKDGANIRGLNTAATIWCSAVTGGFAGAGLPVEAFALALFVLGGNTFLRPLVTLIERAPIDERALEGIYDVRLTVTPSQRDILRDLLVEKLEAASYPVRDIEEAERDDEVELIATLAATSVHPKELDAVTNDLERVAGVRHATWGSRSED
ncbi:MgtC/SapB family protein [Methylocystis bryophila]|uniref:Protein MgtC n=1 Tax=Methylocystis bryophila TaxID=655015 RepID=A0A1W6MT91_9HYPH|nr:MgtC/SapB family protein [Methylocystis bryophila]ARN80814.1 methyltransferase [Methylocystis bryophila]BDV40900.1 methyltransferase [Methylocystis bryophila]